MLPIPMRVLTSSVRVRIPVDGAGGYKEYADPATIGNVRYELASGVRPTSYQLQDGTTGVLFIDALNSVGAFDVPAGSLVSVDGAEAECCVAACRRYEGFGGRVHHWEVELK
jgi:hypothetical protein